MSDLTKRLLDEFRVRDWWSGMDSARGETVPHPLAEEAANEIIQLRSALSRVLGLADRGQAWSLHTRQEVRDVCNAALTHVEQGDQP